jgi:hypothetical protein
VYSKNVHERFDAFVQENRSRQTCFRMIRNVMIVIAFPVIVIGLLVYHFVFSLLGVFFMALIMARSMSTLPYIESVQYTLTILDVALAKLHLFSILFEKFTLVFCPFLQINNFLRDLDLAFVFRSFYLDCGGVQGVSELFLNLLIVYWVVEGGCHTYLSVVAKRFHIRLFFYPTSNAFCSHIGLVYSRFISAKIGASIWACVLLLEPYIGFTQYILGFLTLGKFVSSNGSQGTSGLCQIPNVPYMDEALSYLSTIIALYLLNFGIYTLSKLLVNRRFNNKITFDGSLHFTMTLFSSTDDWLIKWSHKVENDVYSQIPGIVDVPPLSREELDEEWEQNNYYILPPLSTLDDVRLRLYLLIWCPLYIGLRQPKLIRSVIQNYVTAFMACFGIWTDWTTEKSNIIGNLARYCDTHRSEHRKQIFCEAMHAEVGYRLLLLQIIPHWSMTILSVFAVNTAGYPLFVISDEMLNALPPMFEFSHNYPKHTTGILAKFDAIYSFLHGSRGVQAMLRIYSFFCAIVLLFAPTRNKTRALSIGGLALCAAFRTIESLCGFYLYAFEVASAADDNGDDENGDDGPPQQVVGPSQIQLSTYLTHSAAQSSRRRGPTVVSAPVDMDSSNLSAASSNSSDSSAHSVSFGPPTTAVRTQPTTSSRGAYYRTGVAMTNFIPRQFSYNLAASSAASQGSKYWRRPEE